MTDKSKFTNYNIDLVERRFPGIPGIQGWYISFYDNAADLRNDDRYGLRDSSYKKRLGPLYFNPDETLDDKRTYGLWPIPFKNLDPDLQTAIRSFYDEQKKIKNPNINVPLNGSTGGKKTKKSKKTKRSTKKQRKTRKHKK
jgi:hypothetical protein